MSISDTVFHHLIWASRPFLVHPACINVEFLLVCGVRPEHIGDEAQRFTFWPQCLANLPPSIHRDSAGHPPDSIDGAFRLQPLGFALNRWNAPPTTQSSLLKTRATRVLLGSLDNPRQIEIIDIVSSDEIGILVAHQPSHSFEDVFLIPAELVLGARASTINHHCRAQNRIVFHARLQIHRQCDKGRRERICTG